MSIKICPKCKSRELLFLPWLGQIWECKECAWRGVFVIEMDDENS